MNHLLEYGMPGVCLLPIKSDGYSRHRLSFRLDYFWMLPAADIILQILGGRRHSFVTVRPTGVSDMRLDEAQNDPTLLSMARTMCPSSTYANDVLWFQVRDQSLACYTKEAAGIQTNISKQTSQRMQKTASLSSHGRHAIKFQRLTSLYG